MRPDRYVALVILAFAVGYGYLSWQFPLLPFERNQAFRPNVMPMGLAVLGIFFSLAVLFKPGGDETGLTSDVDGWKKYEWGKFIAIVGLMAAYALFLRALGFVPSTLLFLFLGGLILGERRYVLLFIVSIIAAGGSWLLVDLGLGIYLKPLPTFLSTG